MRYIISYYFSFIPLLLVFLSPNPQLGIILLILPGLPILGGFARQLRFYDGVIASLGWVFLSFLMSFETLSVLVINLIIMWGINSVIFIHKKDFQVRQLERKSLLINYNSKEKPLSDWAYMPLDKLQTWATMVQGTQYNRPFPVRVLLYNDFNFKLGGGIYYDTWYEAIVLLNQEFLNKLSPQAQTALTAKQFAHLLRRDTENFKNFLFWLGIILVWAQTFFLIIESINQFNNSVGFVQISMVMLSLIVSYLILNNLLRRQEFNADLHAADMTSLDDVYSLYESARDIIPFKKQNKYKTFLNRVISSNPTNEDRMKYLFKFSETIESYSDEFML